MNTTNVVVGIILGLVTIVATIVSATYILSGDVHEVEIRVLEKLDEKHTKLDNKFDQKFGNLNDKISKLDNKFDQKFGNLNDKISKLDNKAVELRVKVNQIADRLLTKAPDALKQTLTRLDDKIVEISELRNKINELEEGNDGLEAKLETAKNELRSIGETYYLSATKYRDEDNREKAKEFAIKYLQIYNHGLGLTADKEKLKEMRLLVGTAITGKN